MRPDTARVEVPPIDGPLSLEGDTVGTLPFASRAPAWSHTRFGLEQVLDEGATKVGWWAVAATGAARLPELPAGLTLADIGFRGSGRSSRTFTRPSRTAWSGTSRSRRTWRESGRWSRPPRLA